ncbi:hypothetical protein LCGC14_0683920 [marine sediment metagenome]
MAMLAVLLLAGCATPASTGYTGSGPAATEVLGEWKRADRLYARGDLRRAKEGYEMVLEREPGNNEVLFRLANIAYYMQNPAEARELYARVLDSGSVDPQLFYNRAALNLTEAYDDLSRYAQEVGPGNLTPEIRAVMAAIERMSGQRPPINDKAGTAPSGRGE